MTPAGEWSIIKSGDYAGRPHLVGWTLTALLATSTSYRNDGWFGLATCPRCGVLVIHNDRSTISCEMWTHEQWHAATDHPIPAELLEALEER
jgi:hypothetical protein